METNDFLTDREIIATLGRILKEMERPDVVDEQKRRKRNAKVDFCNMGHLDLCTFIEA